MNLIQVVKQGTMSCLLPISMLVPMSALAGVIELSDVTLTARTTFSSQRVPEKSDFDVKTAPPDQLLQAAQALVKDGIPFPNVPNSQNSGFASSAATVGGFFGVGVNGLHLLNSLPPNRYFASGRWTQTLTNNSAVNQVSTGAISVPAPIIRLFGVGDFFPAGADPDLDASAKAEIRLTSTLTHTDGSVVDTVLFDYGLHTFRDSIGGALLANPDGEAPIPTIFFDVFDGSFAFRLPAVLLNFSFGTVAPGEKLEFGYDYFATASTGFGETAVFAAIGDPFDLTVGGGFNFEVVDAAPPPDPGTGIPAPSSLALLLLGLSVLGMRRQYRRFNLCSQPARASGRPCRESRTPKQRVTLILLAGLAMPGVVFAQTLVVPGTIPKVFVDVKHCERDSSTLCSGSGSVGPAANGNASIVAIYYQGTTSGLTLANFSLASVTNPGGVTPAFVSSVNCAACFAEPQPGLYRLAARPAFGNWASGTYVALLTVTRPTGGSVTTMIPIDIPF